MSDPTYADAITSSSASANAAALLDALAANGSPIAGIPTSSPDRGVVEAEGFFLALEQLYRVKMAQSISASSAVQAGDDWVDAVVTWFGETRIPASPAVWTIPLIVAAGAAPITLTAGSIVQVQSTDNNAVFNLTIASPMTLSAGTSYKGTAKFTARLEGTQGNITVGSISAIITGPAGLTVDGTGTQTLITAGRDQETSIQLVDRCLGKWATLGAGWTDQAFDYLIPKFATTLTGWKVDNSNPRGPGTILVTLRNAAGPASDDEVAAVRAGLGSTSVRVLGSGQLFVEKALSYPVTINVTLKGDGSNATLATDADAAFTDPTVGLRVVYPPGQVTLTVDLVRALLMGSKFKDAVKIPSSSSSVALDLKVPGFSGVTEILACDFVADAMIPGGYVLGLTLNITVS